MPDYPTPAADGFEKRSARGQPNGYATLDAFGKVPSTQIVNPNGLLDPTGGLIASNTVTGATSYNLVPNAGSATTFSPGDHSHGSPPTPTFPPIQSPTAPAVATGGTIATAGVTVARVAPTAAVTGVILALTTVPGQPLFVLNESSYSITFAAAGTSNVATGAVCVIAALTQLQFVYDSVTGFWYAASTTTGVAPAGTGTFGAGNFGDLTFGG